jgi:hypothetical protein
MRLKMLLAYKVVCGTSLAIYSRPYNQIPAVRGMSLSCSSSDCLYASTTSMNGCTAAQRRPSESVSRTEQEIELKEIYDNRDYARDDLVTYLSMRDNGRMSRKQYLDGLSQKRIDRIVHEETRIEKLRTAFFTYRTKQELVKAHTERRCAWRKEARDDRDANMRDLEARRLEFEKSQPPPRERTERRRLAFRNEKRVLNAISNWPNDGTMELDVVTEEPTPEPPWDLSADKLNYGLKACIMHFKRGAGGHTHTHKCRGVEGQFPNQKIPVHILLSDIEDNPLREQCKSGTFRYFHLPTNNMAWIEVSILNRF